MASQADRGKAQGGQISPGGGGWRVTAAAFFARHLESKVVGGVLRQRSLRGSWNLRWWVAWYSSVLCEAVRM